MNRRGKSVAQEKPGKGKSVAQEEPQEEENPPSKDFTLKLGDLNGTYPKMMAQIEATMKNMLADEIKKQPDDEHMPLSVSGRIYTPAPGSGMFLVRIVPDQTLGGKVVILLIRWSDLYILAFYVEGVWYHYMDKDFDAKMLPPPSQLPYKPEAGVGVIRLPICSSYGDIGGFQIKVGKPAFTHCILTLGKIGELYSSKQGLKVLKSGPLSLPTITISEAIRFGLWRKWVIRHMDGKADTEVPVEHNSLFDHWLDISSAVADNKSWRRMGLAELVKIVHILMRNKNIKPIKALSEGSSSRSKKN